MFYEIVLLLLLICYAFYRWATKNDNFFKDRGVPYKKPSFLFGNMREFIFRQRSIFDITKELYTSHEGRVFGVFDFRSPVFLVRDPELIKKILIKDFDNFVNRRAIFGEHNSDFFANSLFFLRDSKWKNMRNTLSPAFTGRKMRLTFELINQVAFESIKYLNELATNKTEIEVDMKDFSTRFSNDVIASTAFGLQTNSFREQNNQFYLKGKQVTSLTIWQNLKFFLYLNFTKFSEFFDIKIIGRENSKYFMHLVLDTMKYRQTHNIIRPDMINMLMEATGMITIDNDNQQQHQKWTDIEIVSQCFLFFFAGFEAASVLVSFTTHELMENPDIQKRLFEEIEHVSKELNDLPLSYEALQKMKYLDMVLSETLRKWSAAPFLDRIASKDYIYEADDGETFIIKKGEIIWVPVSGIHHDPKYYPNSNKFDPERFGDDNKSNLVPFTYLPFGIGPRNCIGSRFAMLEAKAMIFYIVKNFRIEAGERTVVPIELLSNGFQLMPKNGFWLKLISRKSD